MSKLTFYITNNTSNPASDLAFTDNLPVGLEIANPGSATTNCNEASLSAPDGGTTISFSSSRLGAGASCTVTVNVVANSSATNTSGDLISSLGNSGSATAKIDVAYDRPGFSKTFVPDTVTVGRTSTLTFSIEYFEAATESADFLTFEDILPTGMVVAAQPNASTDCIGGTLTAVPGSNVISYFGGAVNGGSSCSLSVDVTTGALAGPFINTSGDLKSGISAVSSGLATAKLNVLRDFLNKSFTNDPVVPGGTVNLEFTIQNPDRVNSATSIAFSDNLNSTLTGLVPSGPLPATPCGGGS
ncbi:MAG: hypothetical protein JSU96_00745, partial [Acidobacteriota bacterium]